MMRVILIAVLSLFYCLVPAAAQQLNFGFTPSAPTQTMSVTTSSSSITLSSRPQNTVVVSNTGSNTAFVSNTATATTASFPVPAGVTIALSFPPGSIFSAITGSSTTTLYVTQGLGATALGGAGSGGGGGGGGDVNLTQIAGNNIASGLTNGVLPIDVLTSSNNLYSAITSGVITPGSAVPSTAIYTGGNVAGNGRGWTGVNPTGSVYAQQHDLASIGGTVPDTNSGNKSAGTLRVVLATDQPALTTPMPVASSQSYGAATLSHQVISISSSGDNTVITRVTGTIKVYQLVLSCASQLTTIAIKDGASNALGANSATQYISLGIQSEPLYTTTSTNNFVINLSSGVTCTGFAKYKDS